MTEEKGVLTSAHRVTSVVWFIAGVSARWVAVEHRRQDGEPKEAKAGAVQLLTDGLHLTHERTEAAAVAGQSIQRVNSARLLGDIRTHSVSVLKIPDRDQRPRTDAHSAREREIRVQPHDHAATLSAPPARCPWRLKSLGAP